MGRVLLAIVLSLMLARAFRQLIGGVREGLAGRRGADVPDRGVQMERDPVCGTFVIPSRAVILDDGRRRVHFCSPDCRDKYRTRMA